MNPQGCLVFPDSTTANDPRSLSPRGNPPLGFTLFFVVGDQTVGGDPFSGQLSMFRVVPPPFPPFLDLAGIFLLSCRISASSSLSPLMYITLCLITFVSRYGDNIARSEPLITERVRQAWDHNLIQRCPVPSLGPSCPPNLKLDSSLGIPRTYRTYSTIGY